MDKIKSFYFKYSSLGRKEYCGPISRDFNDSHVEEAGPHLIKQTELTEQGISREAAEFLIKKWNRMGNKFIYWLE